METLYLILIMIMFAICIDSKTQTTSEAMVYFGSDNFKYFCKKYNVIQPDS